MSSFAKHFFLEEIISQFSASLYKSKLILDLATILPPSGKKKINECSF